MLKLLNTILFFTLLTPSISVGQKDVLIEYSADKEINTKTDTVQINITSKGDLSNLADSLIQRSWKKGFILSSISSLYYHKEKTSSIQIVLGSRFNHLYIRSTLFEEINDVDGVSLSRKRDQSIPISNIKNYISSIQDSLQNEGIAFSKVSFDKIEIDLDTLKTNLKILYNKARRIDKIEIKGIVNFPSNLKRNLELKKLIYNKDNIKYIEEEITNSKIALIERPSEVLYKQDSTKLYLYLKKANSNNVEGMVGFNNDDENNLVLNGYLNLKLTNILNAAETLNINYRNDGNSITSLEANISLPLLFFNAIGSRGGLNIVRRDSTYQNQEINAGLYYQPKRSFTLGVEYKSIESNDLTSDESLGNISRYGANGFLNYFSNRRDLLTKQPSFNGVINLGLFNRTRESSSENQIILNATFSKNWHLNNRNQIYTKLSSYYLTSQNVALSESTQIGGMNSIRGFTENVIDTAQYVSLMTEYRRSISDGLFVYSILDVANFEDINTSKIQNLYGIGAGIAILTKSGLLTLSLANGTFEGANFDINSTIAHINLNIYF